MRLTDERPGAVTKVTSRGKPNKVLFSGGGAKPISWSQFTGRGSGEMGQEPAAAGGFASLGSAAGGF